MRLLGTLAWIIVSICPLSSQDTRGAITGTVMDSLQAVVAGASVTITNVGTNTTTRLTTNANGYYEAPLLLPGDYSVTVQMQGFKRYVRSGVTLASGERLQIDVPLEVGGTTESVTVSAEAPLLGTSSVSTGRAIFQPRGDGPAGAGQQRQHAGSLFAGRTGAGHDTVSGARR